MVIESANPIKPALFQRLPDCGALLPIVLITGMGLLSACGSETSQEPVSEQARVVTGSVVKGPLQGATVDFHLVNTDGSAGAQQSTTPSVVMTGTTGSFTVSGLPAGVPILAKSSGGAYFDESDPATGTSRRKITLGSAEGFESVLPANATTLTITPYTHALLEKARIQAAGSNFAAVYAAVLTQATQAFGFNPVTVAPADPISPSATANAAQKQYAILLGAAAQVINAIAVNNGRYPIYADILTFINDFSDGRLDIASLADEARRFRNNNSSSYSDTPLPAVDETLLSQPAPVPNQAPTISDIANQTISEDSATSPLTFTVADAETPAASLIVSGSSSNTTLVPNTNIVFGDSGSSRTVTVTPAGNQSGTATITVTVTDANSGSASDTFVLTVTGINDAPTLNTIPNPAAIPEDATTQTVNLSGIGAGPGESQALTVTATSDNPGLIPNPGVVYTSPNATGALSYAPVANQSGAALITVTVMDNGGTANGGVDSVARTFTVNVTAANDAPVANNDSIAVAEGGTASSLVGGATSVISNDTDGENDPLAAILVTGPANETFFLLNSDGTFTYMHDNSETTTDSFTYKVNDGAADSNVATVTISITPVNDPPVAVDDAYVTDEDTPLTIAAPGVLSNDTDPDSSISVNGFSPTTANGAVSASGDGSFTYTPTTSDFNGTDSFTYTAFDGTATSAPATVTITINSVNDAPVAGNDTYSGTQGGTIATIAGIDGLLLNDTDVDNTPTDLSVTTTPLTLPAFGNLTLNSDGSFSYTHDSSANLVDSFDYEVCDLQPLCVTGTADITLSPAAALLPYLSGSGDLELLDPTLPLDASNPQNLDMGLPISDAFEHETFFTATVSGSNASDIRPARLVYIKNGIVRKVNLERGAGSFSDPLSTITDACRINGSAEDIPNPDNTILRIDTAGTDGVCGTADDNTAPAYLVRLGGDASTVPFQIGVGQCCGNAGITNSSGALIEVLTTEGTGGSTFALNRRSATDFSLIATVATLQISGTGPTYSSYPRGLGDQHIYLRMRRDVVDPTYKLFRYNVAGSTLTELYDYGVPDSTGFTDFLDESPYDASNLYFVDGAKILAVAHDATSPVTVPLVTAPAPVSRLDQTATFLVYEAHDFVAGTGGVFSFPKAGGSAIPLAADDAAPTLASLSSVDRDRVYVSMQSGSAVISYTARVVNANDSTGASAVNTADAQWAGEVRETTIDLLNDFDTGIQAQAIFLRTDAPASTATLKIVDPLTGALSGSTLGTVSEVMPGASVFGFGFGRFAQVTAFKATEHTDLYLGDTQTDNTGPLLFVEGIPSADDIWLLGDGDGGGGGGQQPLDSDGDGLTDSQEASLGTNPNNPDTDGDGLSDFDEVNQDANPGNYTPGQDTNPLDFDTDDDGMSDGEELAFSGSANVYEPGSDTSPFDPDSDDDDVGDGIEFSTNSNPLASNPVYRVDCAAGLTGRDGSQWTDGGPGIGPLGSNADVIAAIGAGGINSSSRVFVLYAAGACTDALTLTGATFRSYVVFLGSVGQGIYAPAYPPTTSFTTAPGTSVIAVSNADNLAFGNIEVSGGNTGTGAGIFVSDTDGGVTNAALHSMSIHGNTAANGGGVAVVASGIGASLEVNDSEIYANDVSAATLGSGRGGGLFATGAATLLVKDSRVHGNSATNTFGADPSHGGGGIYGEGGATVVIENTVIAGNTATNGPGGGVNLIAVGQGNVRNSMLLSNSATRPGAGLHMHIEVSAASFDVFNNLVVGNASTDADAHGAGIEIEHNLGAPLFVSSNTIAYNQSVTNANPNGGGLTIAPTTGPTGPEFRNNIVAFNNDANLGAFEPGDNAFVASPNVPAGNNVLEPTFSGNSGTLPNGADPLFVLGFYLDPLSSPSIDSGDGQATDSNNFASGFFTTNPNADPSNPSTSDQAAVDSGFHHQKGSIGPATFVNSSATPFTAGCPSGTVFLTPETGNGPVGSGHLVVATNLSGPGGSLSAITNLQPLGAGSVIAIDEGTGVYRLDLGGSSAGSYGLDVFVDGAGPFDGSFFCGP